MSDKLAITSEMRALDRKDRGYWDSFTDEEKKKFSTFLMVRWGSCVQGSSELQEFYLVATNLQLNKNFFAASKHPKLQWLMATAVSPGIGEFKHNWIANKKKAGESKNKAVKFLSKIHPTYKTADVELLASLMDDKEVKALAEAHGYTKEQIKKELG